MKLREALEESYKILEPYSNEYRVDFKRFLFSLKLLDLKTSLKDKKILDIGCGLGIMVRALNNLSAEATGLDRFINNQRSDLNIIKGDVLKNSLPFEDNFFDMVTCDAMIEHLPESPKRLFQEARRVLKDGGLFLVTTPNLANLLRRIRFLLGRSPHWDLKDFFEAGENFEGHLREYTLDEVVKMLEWSDFRVLEKKTSSAFFNPRRFLNLVKIPAQLCSLLSFPFPKSREMIFVLSEKCVR